MKKDEIKLNMISTCNWNLKDNVSCGTSYAFAEWYDIETIEILRQKLIEDLTMYKLGCEDYDFNKITTGDARKKELLKMEIANELIKLINKRFGVID